MAGEAAADDGSRPPGGVGVDFFISYVQRDEQWAVWIAWQLESAGYAVRIQAWDFIPGVRFLQETNDAVETAVRTIVVLSAEYPTSHLAAAEWQAAWLADLSGSQRRLLIARVEDCPRPGLLAQVVTVDLFHLDARLAHDRLLAAAGGLRGKPAEEPPYPNVGRPASPPAASPATGPAGQTGELTKSSTALAGPVQPLPAVFPTAPEWFEPRADLLAAARGLLLGPRTTSTVGLVGMGGAGKSTTAKALCADGAVRAAFRDGLVWVDVGPDPDIVACLGRALAAFGDVVPVEDAETTVARLRERLAGKSCLLVLDNVWSDEPVRAFAAAGPEACLLVTTRDKNVLLHGSAACAVGPVDTSTGLRLLAMYAGCSPADVPAAEGREILRRCSGLVLALVIAGGMIAEGHRWSSVAERLRRADLGKVRISSRLREYPDDNLRVVLDASLETLTSGQRERLREIVIFQGRGTIPCAAMADLWAATSEMDHLDAEDLMLLLARRSLINIDERAQRVSVHDLLFDYLRSTLDDARPKELHSLVADRFLARWGGLENGLPRLRTRAGLLDEEKYALCHVAGHLDAAGRHSALHDLLELEVSTPPRNVWFAVHERNGMISSYLADIRLAWQCAERAGDESSAGDGRLEAGALEIRYALITASIRNLARNIPGPLLVRLVETGHWTASQALAYAHLIPDPADRVHAVIALIPHLPTAELHSTLVPTSQSAGSLRDPYDRANATSALLPYLAATERAAVLGRATQAAAMAVDPYSRARALGALAHHLSAADRREVVEPALRSAADLPSPFHRAWALSALAPGLSGDLLDAALDAARAIEDPFFRLWAVATLAKFVPEPARAPVLEPVVRELAAIDQPAKRVRVLGALIPLLERK
ncbi:TIR domain-containing protein [Frankia sp. CNm7]|uniref:TIR domain-containing protein n=1 Tax=Frankia nepalensis TaxID=1836974 RepID=A0A937RL96_9ACTN|nr:toll/interleukin-1 receptor domain-containing protein [Frankia nepalensis]MBL7495143.1 TIR domain-containing protein [Frankia nepalensis]MBL7515603.1 TIR domain-containing protein [Frankia nepalensis]MBL7524714.1 TIR domain-containing protein [Frankia nepalensis]MBL7632397.1 TIR domain-containing protein [Frankia nepalensis]